MDRRLKHARFSGSHAFFAAAVVAAQHRRPSDPFYFFAVFSGTAALLARFVYTFARPLLARALRLLLAVCFVLCFFVLRRDEVWKKFARVGFIGPNDEGGGGD